MMKMLSIKSKKGFTLIELLIVIVIISILAAILFPVFARARENARRASCQSNLKQIALGVIMYSQDYDGKLFPYKYQNTSNDNGSEMNMLVPYIKSVQLWRCPSHRIDYDSSWDRQCKEGSTHWYCSTYQFPAVSAADSQKAALININWGGEVTILDLVPQPSQTCLLAEGRRSSGNYGYTRFKATTPETAGFDGLPVLDRHLGGSNYAFIDGHVKWLDAETVLIPHAENKAIKFYWRDSEIP